MATPFDRNYGGNRGNVAGLEPRLGGGGHFKRNEKSHFTETLAEWLHKFYDTGESQIIRPCARKSHYGVR